MSKKDLLALLGKNQLTKLEQQLAVVLEQKKRQDLEEELAQLKGQHRLYVQHEGEGTHTPAELNAEAARLRKSFSLFIEQLFAEESNVVAAQKKFRFTLPLIILVFCVALIGIGALKWPSIDFVLEAQTRYLAFRLDENWDLDQDIYLEKFLSYTVKSVVIDTLQLQVAEGEELEEVILSGDQRQLKWQEMDIPAGSVLTVEVDDQELNSQVWLDSLRCVFVLQGAAAEIPNREIYETAGNDSTVVLVEMTLVEGPQMAFIPTRDSMFTFQLVPVSGLDFQRADLEDDRGIQSAIVDGKITARDIPYELKNKPYIDLVNPQSTTLSFYQKGDYLTVRVEGKAKDLTIGARPDTQTSIKPTIIEHIGKNARANRIWNWVMGLLGLLSGIVGLWPKRR